MKHHGCDQRTTARSWRHRAFRAGRATATCTISAAVLAGGSMAAVASPAGAASSRSAQMPAAGRQMPPRAPVARATRSAWSLQSPALPSISQGNLFADACSSPASCIAVGTFADSSGTQVPLAEHWNGTDLEPAVRAQPGGATDSELHGVSCSSATSCVAVGFSGAQALGSSGTAPPGRSCPLPRQPAGPHWRACRAAPPATAPPSGLRAARAATSLSPRAGTAPPGPSRPPSTHGGPPGRITTAPLAVCRAPRPQPAPLLDGSPRPSRTM